jgi:hypothetical protein
MAVGKTLVMVAAMVAAALMTTAGAEVEGWRMTWVNPRVQEVPESTWVELIEIIPGVTLPHPFTDEDGGYTFHIYLKTGPKLYWLNTANYVDYTEKYVEYAWKVVAAWNASLKFAAENYEWGRHLSKLRLKFYTDANISQAPRIDIMVDPTIPPIGCPSRADSCTKWGKPIEIPGVLTALPHELGHALGLGHNFLYNDPVAGGPVKSGYDWRGWRIGGIYPEYFDSFILYALSIRWHSLKNSTPNSTVKFDGNQRIVRYDEKLVGPLHSSPGHVWIYYYTVISEPGGVDIPLITNGWAKKDDKKSLLMKPNPSTGLAWALVDTFYNPITHYGGTLCINPLDWVAQFEFTIYGRPTRSEELPLVRVYNNNTGLILHDVDLRLAIRNSTWSYRYTGSNTRDVWVPLKYFSQELLRELGSDSYISKVDVIGDIGPATDKVSRINYRDGRVCLEGLKERLLVEMRIGRAYRVDAGPAEAVPISGKTHIDRNGTNWVLRGSTVYFRPLNASFTSGGVKYLWRGVNLTVTVNEPVELTDRLWSKQYLVEVDSPYPFDGTGWFEPGSRASPKPVGGHVDLGNGTRLVLKGFEGYNGTEVVVDKPLKLKPVWERMYRVDTVSRYIVETTDYFKEGDTLYTLMPRRKDFVNGTYIELKNMTAYGPSGETISTWNGRAGNTDTGLLKTYADRPLRIVVEWNVYHWLTVTSPVDSYGEWVLNGTAYRLNLPEKKLINNDELLELKQVKVNGKPHQGLEVTITSPTSIEAVYQRKLMTTFMVDAGKGYLVEPSEIVLERDGEVEVYKPPFTYIGEGTWKVVKTTYLSGDITTNAVIEISMAGMKVIPSRLRAVEVVVVDFIGIPIPQAFVKTESSGQITDMLGRATMSAIPPWDFEVEVTHILGNSVGVMRPSETTIKLTAGISPYTIILTIILIALGVVIWRRKHP